MRRRALLRATAGCLTLGAIGTGRATSGYSPLGEVAIPGAKEAVVGPDGTTVYVATTDGFATVSIADPTNPRVLTVTRDLLDDHPNGPLTDIQDLAVAGDRLLVVGPAHRRSRDQLKAAIVYDIQEPSAPDRQVVHETDFAIHNGALTGENAYLTGNDGSANPLVVVRMTPTGSRELARWSLLESNQDWMRVDAGLRQLHDVTLHGNRAYCNYWDAGTWILDISSPTKPTLLGRAGGRSLETLAAIDQEAVTTARVELPGNHHSAAVNDTGTLLAVGQEAWNQSDTGPGPGGIKLWDITEPAAPVLLSRISPPATRDATSGGLWTTAHKFDLAGGRLYSAWYQGGVKLHDISSPHEPDEIAWWRQPPTTRFWTAQSASTGVVASSMGINDSKAGLYLFPDRPGEQPDPPSLTAPTSATTSGTPPSPPAGTSASENGGTHPHTVRNETRQPTRTETDTTVTDGQPGFGLLAALSAVSVAAWRRR